MHAHAISSRRRAYISGGSRGGLRGLEPSLALKRRKIHPMTGDWMRVLVRAIEMTKRTRANANDHTYVIRTF